MIKAIFFDLWSTLAQSKPNYKKALELAGWTRTPENNKLFEEKINTRHFDSFKELAITICKTFGNEKKLSEVTNLLEHDKGEYFSDVIPVLTELKKSYKIGLITNTNNLDLQNLNTSIFNSITVSADVGVVKPNKKIFLHALKSLDIKPKEAIMIGDNPYTDIQGAKNVGMKTILISRYGYNQEREHIKNLKELLVKVKEFE